ncbi:MAG: hypothetical protein Q7S40_22350 [Opitutaceae bacterium]|nr:hypothetical protein [Opitutaceae bacterium]
MPDDRLADVASLGTRFPKIVAKVRDPDQYQHNAAQRPQPKERHRFFIFPLSLYPWSPTAPPKTGKLSRRSRSTNREKEEEND